jgi:hypothetical protein
MIHEWMSYPVPKAEAAYLEPLNACIIGPPSRPTVPDSAWLTATVLALAQSVRTDAAFDRLPILADALMDAGCENIDVLKHCRCEGPHVRGCWVVNLLLGMPPPDNTAPA